IRVVNGKRTSLILLIFPLVTYVRDAGVAGSNPAAPTILPAMPPVRVTFPSNQCRLGSRPARYRIRVGVSALAAGAPLAGFWK
ncbi:MULTISPECIES: hypothetical protein, partial [unclassified Bradyrhizobium]|uniref:hypothetical protein n=2 Tax=Bradyrhizobium TaxID=374 RepID=UPI0029168FEC